MYCENCGNKLNSNKKCEKCDSKQKSKTNKKLIILVISIIIIISLIAIAWYSTPYTCDEGTLVGDECISCPEGYTLNIEEKNCEKKLTEEEIKKNNEKIIKDYKENCKKYKYKEIFRYAENYKGKYAKFTGEVIQTQDNSINGVEAYALRVNVTKTNYGYEDTIYVNYLPMNGATRILEEDIVTIYGILNGLETYESILGAEITIPSIISNYIEIK